MAGMAAEDLQGDSVGAVAPYCPILRRGTLASAEPKGTRSNRDPKPGVAYQH